jgi:hypothetical protein
MPDLGPLRGALATLATEIEAARVAVAKRARVVNVRDFGALGNDSHNETAAFAAASVAVVAAGGGTIYVPDGTYRASQIAPGVGATIHGQSRAGTILKMAGTSAMKLDLSDCLVYMVAARSGLANLTLYGRGNATPAYNEILLGMDGWNGTPNNITVSGVTIDHAAGRGWFTGGPTAYGTYSDIVINNTFLGSGSHVYGNAAFLYDAFCHNAVNRLVIDTSAHTGLYFDGGSSSGPYAFNEHNALTNCSIAHAGTAGGSPPPMMVKGSQYNTFDGFTLRDSYADGFAALTVMFQQQGLSCTHNAFTNFTLSNIGGPAIYLQSACSNTFQHWSISNIGKAWTAQIVQLAWTDWNGGSGGGSNDNVFDDIHLDTQTDKTWYANGVLFDTQHEPMLRNAFSNMAWDAPTSAVVGWVGDPALAPLTGANANTGLT